MDVRVIYRTCPACGRRFSQPDDPGRKRRFCSDACKQAAYRARKRAREQARQRAQDDAHRRAREEQTRRQRDRARSHRPPPHAGRSRPGRFCSSCGGHRGPHTFHHDQARPRPRPAPLRRPSRQGQQHRVPRGDRRLPSQGRTAPRQVRPLGDDGRIVTRPPAKQGERYGSSVTRRDGRFVTRLRQAARQALRSGRRTWRANRNSRASSSVACYDPSATLLGLPRSGCCYVPSATLPAAPVPNGSVSLAERSWGSRQDSTSGTSA
jgi:endogenous inhibitor of DNA gyrase (YacG/DUF329 family)